MKFSVFKPSRDVDFQRSLVVDADNHFKELIDGYCLNVGFKESENFTDFDSAWLKMQDNKYDLIVIDWSTKSEMSSSAFFNRVKLHPKFKNTPIVVLTGFKVKGDFRLVHEFPFTWVVEKPFTEALFHETIEEVAAELEWLSRSKDSLGIYSRKPCKILKSRKNSCRLCKKFKISRKKRFDLWSGSLWNW